MFVKVAQLKLIKDDIIIRWTATESRVSNSLWWSSDLKSPEAFVETGPGILIHVVSLLPMDLMDWGT